MLRKSLILGIILICLFSVFSGCSKEEKPSQSNSNGQLKIMTSFYPMYIATINVTKGIDGVTVENMTKPQIGCLHDYQLSTDDMKKLEKTDIFVINGAGMESFLEKAVKKQKKMKIIEAAKGIKLIKDQEGDNPHVWLSISRASAQVKNIADGLAKADPAHADKYKSNAAEYIKKLDKLKMEAKEELSNIKNRDIVTFHEAFPYFAEEFDLKIVTVIEREPGSEPTPKELEMTIEKVRQLPIKVLFTEPQYSPNAAKLIAKESGAKIYQLDPVVTGEAKPEAREMYLETMRKNIKLLKEALN